MEKESERRVGRDESGHNNISSNGREVDDQPHGPSEEHPIIPQEALGKGGLPVFLVVLLAPCSKLILLYSSQFGIYIMPQLDTLDSISPYTQLGTAFSLFATDSSKTPSSSSASPLNNSHASLPE